MLERATIENKQGKYLASFVARRNQIDSMVNSFLFESNINKDEVNIYYIEEAESDYE